MADGLAGLAIPLTTLAFNLLGDGLRDAFDPRAAHFTWPLRALARSFFAGNRGSFRVANEEGMVGIRVPRGLRVASAEEQTESFTMTGLRVIAGIVLQALGAAVDSNARLL